MRPAHLFWMLSGISAICEASPKPRTSSSSSNSHKISVSTPRHISVTIKHSANSPKHVAPSSKISRSTKTTHNSPSTSTPTTSISRAFETSKSSRITTKAKPTNHDSMSSSSQTFKASHKSTILMSDPKHKISSSADLKPRTSQTSLSPTATLHRAVSLSSSSSSLSIAQKPSQTTESLFTSVASTLGKSVPRPNETIKTAPLPLILSKQTIIEAAQTSKIISKFPQISATSISIDDHKNVPQKTSNTSVSSENGTNTSVAFRKASITQPITMNYTVASSSRASISPSGLASQTFVSNKTGPCADGTFVDASCFSALHLSEYLVQWWADNEGTCKSKNAQFARCFYALETPYGPSDCAQINNDAACTQPVWNDFKDTKHGIQSFYVAWNLWNTAGFFLDLWTAMGAAEASSQASLASLVTLLDPPQEKTKMEYVLDALSFGLSLYAEGSIFMKALLRSAPQGYGLGGKIFQRGTVNGEYQDWTVIAANLGQCTDIFRATVAEELPLIQNNLSTFIQWSEISGLSGYRAPLNGLAQNMTQALNTYAIARILDTQGVIITRASNTDVHALQTNGSQLNWDTGCGSGYDSLGICDTFFWDGVDTYGLTDPLHFTKNYHDELEAMFTPKDNAPSLTTGRLLFSGAQHCYEATGQNGGSPPLLDPLDASHIVCLSNAPVCTWDESGYGPFDSSCKNNPDKDAPLYGFGASGCKGEDNSIFSINVPRSYLGPGIYQDAKNIDALYADSFCDDVDF